jgi:hypothetical protein
MSGAPPNDEPVLPDVDWEKVKHMPHALPAARGEGAYRTSEGSRIEVVRAHRPPRSLLATLGDWLRAESSAHFRAQPLEVVVTDDDVYARFRDRSVGRLPVAMLRAALRGERGEVTYLFGRSARLRLPHVEGCPVEALLEAAVRENGQARTRAREHT